MEGRAFGFIALTSLQALLLLVGPSTSVRTLQRPEREPDSTIIIQLSPDDLSESANNPSQILEQAEKARHRQKRAPSTTSSSSQLAWPVRKASIWKAQFSVQFGW